MRKLVIKVAGIAVLVSIPAAICLAGTTGSEALKDRLADVAQVEMRQLVDSVVRRQEGLAQEVAALRGQLQQLAGRPPGPQALWD